MPPKRKSWAQELAATASRGKKARVESLVTQAVDGAVAKFQKICEKEAAKGFFSAGSYIKLKPFAIKLSPDDARVIEGSPVIETIALECKARLSQVCSFLLLPRIIQTARPLGRARRKRNLESLSLGLRERVMARRRRAGEPQTMLESA